MNNTITLMHQQANKTELWPLSYEELRMWRNSPALQQPDWDDKLELDDTRREISRLPGIVSVAEIDQLKTLLSMVAEGDLGIIQAGDCAEDFRENTLTHLERKVGLLQGLAGVMRMNMENPVIPVGRIAGQFAKPRSKPTERHGNIELPVYRGELVNSPEPTVESRIPDPSRLLAGYRAANLASEYLRTCGSWWSDDGFSRVWTSHEALVLDYELPLVRRSSSGSLYLTSTHWPWIGDRTRQIDGAHVRLLSEVSNPVACKIGPTTSKSEVLKLCEQLDPKRQPGRLTLIARMGAERVRSSLPELVEAVRSAGHPIVWLCDPMHGNTVKTPEGDKTRIVDVLEQEVMGFRDAVTDAGGTIGGMHLEATPEAVNECAMSNNDVDTVGDNYTTLCDPRLNAEQAFRLARSWC